MFGVLQSQIKVNAKTKRIFDYIICAALLTPFLQPRGMREMLDIAGGFIPDLINSLFWRGKYVVILIMAIALVVKRIKPSTITVLSLSYYFYFWYVCFLRGAPSDAARSDFFFVLGIALIAEFYRAVDLKVLINTLAWYLGVIAAANFALILIFPGGLYADARGWETNWLLGYHNSHIFTYLPWLTIILMIVLRRTGKMTLTAFAAVALVFLSVFIVDSLTSVIAVAVLFLLLLFSLKITSLKPPNIIFGLVANLALSLGLIVFNVQEKFSYMIEKILGRDVTLTGRVEIWERALKKIAESPVVGSGYAEYPFPDWTATSAHNTILDVLVTGGIVGAVIFCSIFVVTGIHMSRSMRHPYAKLAASVILAYFVSFLVEKYQLPHLFFLVCFFAYNVEDFIKAFPIENKPRALYLPFLPCRVGKRSEKTENDPT